MAESITVPLAALRFMVFDIINLESDPDSSISADIPTDEKVNRLQSQLQNLRRSMNVLQTNLFDLHKMELEIHKEVKVVAKLEIEQPPPLPLLPGESPRIAKDTLDAPKVKTQPSAPKPVVIRPEDREIRLFISSPFRDMQDERDLIVKRVIPKIRRMCFERDINFSYVDLRW